jgi:hypothetical protein
MTKSSLETIHDLTSVCGGNCFDDVWPWVLGGAIGGAGGGPVGAGLGGLGGGVGAALSAPSCGDGERSLATILREPLIQPKTRKSDGRSKR